MSVISEGFATWRECRAEYDVVLYAQHEAAADACRDALVNREGRRRGIAPISLFMGPWVRARKWASAELLEWWAEHPRVTFAEFERQWVATRDAEMRA